MTSHLSKSLSLKCFWDEDYTRMMLSGFQSIKCRGTTLQLTETLPLPVLSFLVMFQTTVYQGVEIRNAKWFPMTVVTVHCGKLEQESQPLKITVNCESPVNFPVFTGL